MHRYIMTAFNFAALAEIKLSAALQVLLLPGCCRPSVPKAALCRVRARHHCQRP